MDFDPDPQRRSDRVYGDVVVGRPDPTGGEQIVVTGAQLVHRLGDRIHVVGDDPHFLEPYALQTQPGRHLGDVLVVGPAGENLVANHDQRGGVDAGFGHRSSDYSTISLASSEVGASRAL
jgi:hypothetical protein